MLRPSPVPCVLSLFAAIVLVITSCGHETSLPTAASAAIEGHTMVPEDRVAPLVARGTVGRHHRAALVTEARAALGALVTAEQVYYQKTGGTYLAVSDTTDLSAVLGLELVDTLNRWAFSVRAISVNGFVARARGRHQTVAEGITVTLSYRRSEPFRWSVVDAHRRRR